MMARGAVLLTVGAALLLTASAANASSTTTIVGDRQKLTIDLIGHVPGRCGFSTPPADQVLPGDLSTGGSVTVPFTLDCNTPFRVRAASTNGGFRTTAAADGFSNLLDYRLRLRLETDAGGLDAACNADELVSAAGDCAYYGVVAGEGLSSADGVSLHKTGALDFTWATARQRLVAGRYSDTLTIVVEVRS